jgi:phosphate transport system substrate-binding protein
MSLRNCACALAALLALSAPALARDQIRIVGSSTVYPFAASVAEHLGHESGFRTPVVESTGTGAGFKLFCGGTGSSTPDISDASRPILDSEREACEAAGVSAALAVAFGFDGITLANSAHAPHFRLTRKALFLALAREVPVAGKLAANPYTRWRQVDATLPDLPIKLYGTPPVSGTRDTFVELVMQKGCEQVHEMAQLVPDKDARKRACSSLREDGLFIEAGENGNLIAQKLIGDEDALGIFGFSFLDQNEGRIQGSAIDGVEPRFETIQNGTYPVSRKLLFYVKTQHLDAIPGIRDYVRVFTSEAAIGDEGYLAVQGLVPLPEADRKALRESVGKTLGF